MTTQTDLTLSPAALGAAVLGIAPESTAGKVLSALPKANRLTAAQTVQLAAWAKSQPRDVLESSRWPLLAEAASKAFGYRVTESNIQFITETVCGIRKPAKVKPAVQDHFCVSAATIARIQENYSHINSDLGMTQRNFESYRAESLKAVEQLRADVGAIAFALYSQYPGTMNELHSIAERNAK